MSLDFSVTDILLTSDDFEEYVSYDPVTNKLIIEEIATNVNDADILEYVIVITASVLDDGDEFVDTLKFDIYPDCETIQRIDQDDDKVLSDFTLKVNENIDGGSYYEVKFDQWTSKYPNACPIEYSLQRTEKTWDNQLDFIHNRMYFED